MTQDELGTTIDGLRKVINEQAAPLVVDCVECGAPIALSSHARLYCSDVCRQTLKLIHYGRAVVADGRLERDPTVAEALQMRIAQVLAGGYHDARQRLSTALRRQIMERDGGRCVLCGAAATQIDHIAGDSNVPENLRATCGTCNLRMAQVHLAPAPPRQRAIANRLLERILLDAPAQPRDDETTWRAISTQLLSDRRDRLRIHRLAGRLKVLASEG